MVHSNNKSSIQILSFLSLIPHQYNILDKKVVNYFPYLISSNTCLFENFYTLFKFVFLWGNIKMMLDNNMITVNHYLRCDKEIGCQLANCACIQWFLYFNWMHRVFVLFNFITIKGCRNEGFIQKWFKHLVMEGKFCVKIVFAHTCSLPVITKILWNSFFSWNIVKKGIPVTLSWGISYNFLAKLLQSTLYIFSNKNS